MNEKTDTPETDAAYKLFTGTRGNDGIHPWSLCRKLERERDEARKEIEWLKSNYICEGGGT